MLSRAAGALGVGFRRVRVGSTNPPKLAAVRAALEAYAAAVEVAGVAVESGVPEQPVGFDEIVLGARTRAERAFASASCDLAVGIEDGLVEIPVSDLGILNVGCAAITDGTRRSVGFSAAFAYPPECARPAVRERLAVGALFDRLWARSRSSAADRDAGPSSLSLGNVGRLTSGVLPRAEYARHAVLCALVRFLQPDLYPIEPNDAEGRT